MKKNLIYILIAVVVVILIVVFAMKGKKSQAPTPAPQDLMNQEETTPTTETGEANLETPTTVEKPAKTP